MDIYNTFLKIEKFTKERKEFSQQNFGSFEERGPEGPLEHLIDESQEVLAAPKDRMEYADCFLLLLDAYNRAGLGDLFDLIDDANTKLNINKSRTWKKVGNTYKHIEDQKTKKEDTIEDGFGSVWSKQCIMCKQDSMFVVRPGEAQCGICG